MKKLVAILLTSFSLFSSSYQELRNNFKEHLYLRQSALLSRKKYFKFIEPYLQKAEAKLSIVRYLQSNPEFDLNEDYFNSLLDYNVIYFNNYISKDKFASSLLSYEQAVFNNIMKIKDSTVDLSDLDVQQELQQTIQLFQKANKAYYKKLGLHMKLLAALFG